ncbi:hypothetical protein F443_12987 [Phytophthora nicotianae P1569]|uniref:Uncharacterized protein n=1 Tax=Phytophthora nicotianae P1569 TaxID=1317065 RepID=V9EUS4_PHYNI|nr:hypothetical protein F443_12987 [Phytophthora nicotianae P1569]
MTRATTPVDHIARKQQHVLWNFYRKVSTLGLRSGLWNGQVEGSVSYTPVTRFSRVGIAVTLQSPFSSMFANHLVTIAPHAAVIVSPVDHSSQQRSSSTTGNSSRHTKKQRAKSEDLNSNNNKKEAATSRYSS